MSTYKYVQYMGGICGSEIALGRSLGCPFRGRRRPWLRGSTPEMGKELHAREDCASCSLLRASDDFSTTYTKAQRLTDDSLEVCSPEPHGIRFPMRGLWRVERHQRGRNRRPPAELRRRLPGLLQTQCAEGGIRYVVAGILYDSVFGVSRQHLRAFLCDLRD